MSGSADSTPSPKGGTTPPGGNTIPPRRRFRPSRQETIPPQPSLRRHTLRLAAATGLGILLMLGLLMLAMRYAQRDWQRKNQLARRGGQTGGQTEASAWTSNGTPPGRAYTPPPRVVDLCLERLTSDPFIPNAWLLLGRGLVDRQNARTAEDALRMAMAVSGENAVMKNDLGAALLQQNRLVPAEREFRAALQIEPGFPPAIFNLALCAIADRQPALGTELLAQYLARRPDDAAAYRLQATLLAQLGRRREALILLEKFLRRQPPEQPLFLDAALLAARLGENGNALRYLETALNGNSIQAVVRAYQSPAFRDIRLSGEGDALASRMAARARVTFSVPIPVQDYQPQRAPLRAIVR